MSELTNSFTPVDPETWQAALDAVGRLKGFFWRGRVLWDVSGKPITEVGQLTACIYAGTWPPFKGPAVVIRNGGGEADALALREAAAILGEVERESVA